MRGCSKDAAVALQRVVEEVEKRTNERNIQADANAIEKESPQKLHETTRVNRAPTEMIPNISKIENIDRAEQRLVL